MPNNPRRIPAAPRVRPPPRGGAAKANVSREPVGCWYYIEPAIAPPTLPNRQFFAGPDAACATQDPRVSRTGGCAAAVVAEFWGNSMKMKGRRSGNAATEKIDRPLSGKKRRQGAAAQRCAAGFRGAAAALRHADMRPICGPIYLVKKGRRRGGNASGPPSSWSRADLLYAYAESQDQIEDLKRRLADRSELERRLSRDIKRAVAGRAAAMKRIVAAESELKGM